MAAAPGSVRARGLASTAQPAQRRSGPSGVLALEQWVTKDVEPPPSRLPRIADGTAVVAATVRMPVVPGFAVAPGANPIVPPVDIADPPARIDNVHGTLVSAVDADGNEIAGIRLPPIAVPLGTHTEWTLYRAQPAELADRDGSLTPFARSRAEREAAGDPRPSIEERYGSGQTYVPEIEAAAAALVVERLLLPTDAEAYVKTTKAYDKF
jgi:hypothetical protein